MKEVNWNKTYGEIHAKTLTETADNLRDVIKALDALADVMIPNLPDHHQKLCDVALTGISGRIEDETFAIDHVASDLSELNDLSEYAESSL